MVKDYCIIADKKYLKLQLEILKNLGYSLGRSNMSVSKMYSLMGHLEKYYISYRYMPKTIFINIISEEKVKSIEVTFEHYLSMFGYTKTLKAYKKELETIDLSNCYLLIKPEHIENEKELINEINRLGCTRTISIMDLYYLIFEGHVALGGSRDRFIEKNYKNKKKEIFFINGKFTFNNNQSIITKLIKNEKATVKGRFIKAPKIVPNITRGQRPTGIAVFSRSTSITTKCGHIGFRARRKETTVSIEDSSDHVPF